MGEIRQCQHNTIYLRCQKPLNFIKEILLLKSSWLLHRCWTYHQFLMSATAIGIHSINCHNTSLVQLVNGINGKKNQEPAATLLIFKMRWIQNMFAVVREKFTLGVVRNEKMANQSAAAAVEETEWSKKRNFRKVISTSAVI